MKLETNLPERVKKVEYAKNTHYLKLTDKDNNETKLNARDIIQYTCKKCKESFWMGSNMADKCPICGGKDISKDWVDLQLSFIPEADSRFNT